MEFSIWNVKLWLSVILIFIIQRLIKFYWSRRNYPPGPFPYPIFGNLFSFTSDLNVHKDMYDWSKKYGDVMTVFFGAKPHIILTKCETAREIMPLAAFSDRPKSVVTKTLFGDTMDIGMGKYGPRWQLYKKTASKCMRTVVEAEKLEDKLVEAVDTTVEKMVEEGRLDPLIHMQHILYNTLSLFAFGKTYQMDDPEFLELMDVNETMSKEVLKLMAFDYVVPLAEYLPLIKLPSFKRTLGFFRASKTFCQRQIDEHKRDGAYDGEPRDFCDALLQEQELLKRSGDEIQLRDEDVPLILMDFFSAGTASTAAVLTWFVFFMTTNPDLQENCYKAIKETIGDRQPKIGDRSKLAIVEACLMETLRFRPPAPLGFPHATTEEARLGEYILPKGTALMTNIYAMHMDPSNWANPTAFDPKSHFIDNDGQIKKPASFSPFGFGRRICLGEQLAKKDMFVAVVRLLQKLRFEMLDGENYDPDKEPEHGIANKPPTYTIRVVARN